MIDYQDQAKQFLLDCNATMEIKFVGKEIPAHWKGETKPHNKYQFRITTPKGKYTSYFWDSLRNTEVSEMTFKEFMHTSNPHLDNLARESEIQRTADEEAAYEDRHDNTKLVLKGN